MKKHPARSHDSKMVSGTEPVPILHNEKVPYRYKKIGEGMPSGDHGKAIFECGNEYYHGSPDFKGGSKSAPVRSGTTDEAIANTDKRHDRPGTPESMKDRSRADKQATQGFATHDKVRLNGPFKPDSVDSTDHSAVRSDFVPRNEDAGSISSSGSKSRRPNTRCEENVSSFGGRKYKA